MSAAEAQALREALGVIARLGTTLTYDQAATILGLAPPLRVRRVATLLEAMLAEDAAAGRPILAALVVGRRRGGRPGPGFFAAADAAGLRRAGEDDAALHARLRAEAWRSGPARERVR